LAVVALAPLALIAASSRFLATVDRIGAAILLLVVAVVYLLAALWVDRQRPERDLWRPLTGAAIVFITAASQRLAGDSYTAAAWCAEAAVLVWIGLRPNGGWLRFCGYVVAGLGTLWMVVAMASNELRFNTPAGTFAFMDPGAWRDLFCLIALLAIASMTARRRDLLSPGESAVPEIWTVAANFLLMTRGAREARDLARSFAGSSTAAQETVGAVLTSAAWTVQAILLLALGWRESSPFMRWLGLGLFGITVVKFLLVDLQQVDVFWRFLTAIAVGAVLLAVSYLYQRRVRERRADEPAAR
jgi:uncharacterized membrane protein